MQLYSNSKNNNLNTHLNYIALNVLASSISLKLTCDKLIAVSLDNGLDKQAMGVNGYSGCTFTLFIGLG